MGKDSESGSTTPILLIGFKGCGKTTVGRLLAQRVGRRFIDLDDFLSDLHEERSGERYSFRDLYQRVGDRSFRRLEREAARRLGQIAAETTGALIISVGGGAIEDEQTRRALKAIGRVVCLEAPFPELLERVRQSGPPAYVDPSAVERDLCDLFKRREPLLLETADLVVNIAQCDPAQAAERVLTALDE